MSVARFIADQRTRYRVPHTVTCLLLGVSLAWFYKWRDRALGPAASSGLFTAMDRRRDTIDRAVRVMFTKKRGLHGSPRLHADLRDDGLNAQHPMTASLGQLTMTWASPIHVDAEKNKERTVTELLKSSSMSWVSASTDLLPNYDAYPQNGFPVSGKREPRLLAVALEGRFDSFYAGKPSPLAASGKSNGDDAKNPAASNTPRNVIAHSPASARMIVIGSNAFGSDLAMNLISQGLNTMYTKQLDFLQNAVDWSLEDRDLLALRGRTQFARTLSPRDEATQRFWEYANYALALLGLFLIRLWRQRVTSSDRKRYARIVEEI